MRWEDERYVRVYTRDTGNWITLSWEARALLVFLFRKVDRAGMLDLGDDTMPALAALVGMPIEVVGRALPELLRKKSVGLQNGRLTIPNFLEAQETRSSDAQRKRDQRERALAKEKQVSDENVTSGHQESPAVTDGHSVPICAVPSRTVPSEETPPTASPTVDPIPDVGFKVEPAQLALAASEPPRQKRPKLRHPADVRTLQEVYRAGWVAQFKPKDGKPPAPLPGDATLLDGLLEAHGLVECQRLVNAFLSDPDAFLAKQGHRLRLLPAKVDAYRATRAPPRSPAIGYAQPSEFKGEGGDRTHVFRRRNA